MYWTDVISYAIIQSNLDGSEIVTMLSQGLAAPGMNYIYRTLK